MSYYQCPSYASSYPSIMNGPCCPPMYPPCPPSPQCSSVCGVSKLANFVHYGGGGAADCGNNTNPCCPRPPQQQQNCRPNNGCGGNNRKPVSRRCPPLPPCAPTCITPNCKDMPAQRLRNVDVLEELCYYVPGCDPSCAMDCYSVDCCGNVEKISEGDCCGQECCCPPNPVKYSRRQRFTFNESGNGRSSFDPWPFEGNCGDSPGVGARGGARRASIGGAQGNPNDPANNPCCGSGGRKYTYCPEDPVDCSEMLPPESGVYYFDRERKAFVPEKDLPRPPEVIEREVRVPDVEEYELLEEERGSGSSASREPERQTIQPVVQPIIMPSSCPPNTCPAPPCLPYNPYPPPCNPYQPSPCAPQYNNPCQPPCNPYQPPCAPQQCNPCCNPCAPQQCNPCNPCGGFNSCNPCCNPCGPMNPFMNMCGGVLPMVIPMCPQQPAGGGGYNSLPPPGAPPPPPFPFPPPFFQKTKKKKKSSRTTKSSRPSGDSNGTDPYSDNIIVPGAPEDLIRQMGEDIPSNAYGVDMGDNIDVDDDLPPLDDNEVGGGGRNNVDDGGYGKTVQAMGDGTIVTTIDFPPGEADNVNVTATKRKNMKEPNIDVVAELQGGKAKGPTPPGQKVAPQTQYTTADGTTVTSYQMPEGKDGFVKATSATKL